ncbi:MAG: hypothetical protein AAGH92_01910 [Planctomycetota bacterium]
MTFPIQDSARVQDALRPDARMPGTAPLADPLSGLASVVILAGSVRANQLRRATGRSPLEMPIASSRTVMHEWCDRLADTAEAAGIAELPVRIMVDQAASPDFATDDHGPLRLRVERDPSSYRGTAGLLHDLAREYPDDAKLLVLHASQLPFASLGHALGYEHANSADVTIVADPQGSPSGIMLLRCGCLRDINTVGFVDLNEQALPNIAEKYDVRVHRTAQPVTRSLRTLSGYLETLRLFHHQRTGRLVHDGPFAEDWQASFQVLEGGSFINDRAVIHDSVVLAGARVEADAVIVRSVVCPGAVVGKGEHRVDRVVIGHKH